MFFFRRKAQPASATAQALAALAAGETESARTCARAGQAGAERETCRLLLGLIEAQAGAAQAAHEWLAPPPAPDLRARARALLEALCAIAPGHAPALTEHARRAAQALKAHGETLAAGLCLALAAELGQRSAQALYLLGDTLHDLRALPEAEDALQEALAADPEHWGACYTYAVLMQDMGRDEEAIAYYQRALALQPEHAKTHNNLGSALFNGGRLDEALPHFERAAALDPKLAMAQANRGTVLNLSGRWRDAIDAFGHALALGAPPGIAVKQALVLPAVAATAAEIDEARAGLEERIQALGAAQLRLSDPVREVGMTPFYLAYQGRDDLPLMRALASFYLQACPQLAYVAPHVGKRRPDGPLRVAFVSTFFRNHTIGRYFHQVIRKLDRKRFRVIAASPFAHADAISAGIRRDADETVVLPVALAGAQAALAAARPDLVVYADIGTEPLTYFLAFARLAPVQAALYGHPVTTGIPNVDCFLSHEACEPADAASHYSERLLCLPRDVAYTYYERPQAPAGAASAQALGLDPSAHLYLCGQSLFKLHPDMDPLFARILREDGAGQLLLFEGEQAVWTERLRSRLTAVMPDVAPRVRFLPRGSRERFLAVQRAAHVVLDSLHFSGGGTTLDGFAMGAPIVTLPGRHMRGRQTLACYDRMGLADWVAASPGDYVSRALQLAREPELRRDLTARIDAANGALFGDLGMVRALEGLIERIAPR